VYLTDVERILLLSCFDPEVGSSRLGAAVGKKGAQWRANLLPAAPLLPMLQRDRRDVTHGMWLMSHDTFENCPLSSIVGCWLLVGGCWLVVAVRWYGHRSSKGLLRRESSQGPTSQE
jgi:hypothetical protein